MLCMSMRYPKIVHTTPVLCVDVVVLSAYPLVHDCDVMHYPIAYVLSDLFKQVPMCVVAPGKQPRTKSELALSTSSGHIIHLMPGDHLYDPASFNIVLVWNGVNHYIPSFLMHHKAILQFRCSIISKLLSNATELFSEIESDLDDSKDEDLIETFHELRDTTIMSQHLLSTRGMESAPTPSSTCGPDPRDYSKHLTRKTPLPHHPQPLIAFAMSHSLDPDSALKKEHPTPVMPPPPPPEDIKSEDFNIQPSTFESDTVRCVKTAGQVAPGKLLPSKQQLLVSIPLPLDPVQGHPPANPDSAGAKRFRENPVKPTPASELVEIVQSLPYDGSRIAQKTSTEDDGSGRIAHEGIISEKVQKKVTSKKEEKDKVKALKKKMLGSRRKSPRVKIPKLDLSKGIHAGVKETLKKKERSAVESIAKNVISAVTEETDIPEPEEDSTHMEPSASSSSSSQASQRHRQRSILEMYAQAASRIPRKQKPSASQGSASQDPDIEVLPGPPPVSRVSAAPPAQRRIAQSSQPAPPAQRRIAQSSQLVAPPQLVHAPPWSQIAQSSQKSQQHSAPPPQCRIVQSSQKHSAPSQLVAPPQLVHAPPQSRITQSSQKSSQDSGPILRCTVCPYSTKRKESLNDHMRMHSGEKLKCDFCEKDYFSKKSLKNHIKFNHMKIDRCSCTVVGCTWSGKDYGLRTVHLYEEHGIGPAPVCDHPDCRGRGHFSNFHTLERHRETFHKPKDLQCPHCERKYKDSETLLNHVGVVHKGKPALQCEVCGGIYGSKKSLSVQTSQEH